MGADAHWLCLSEGGLRRRTREAFSLQTLSDADSTIRRPPRILLARKTDNPPEASRRACEICLAAAHPGRGRNGLRLDLATKSSHGGRIAGDAERGTRVVPRGHELLRKAGRSGRAGARPQDPGLGPHARFQVRNEARASVRASAPERSGATRSRRWFTRPRRLSSRLLSLGTTGVSDDLAQQDSRSVAPCP